MSAGRAQDFQVIKLKVNVCESLKWILIFNQSCPACGYLDSQLKKKEDRRGSVLSFLESNFIVIYGLSYITKSIMMTNYQLLRNNKEKLTSVK